MKLLLALSMLLSLTVTAIETGASKKADDSLTLKRSKAARIV